MEFYTRDEIVAYLNTLTKIGEISYNETNPEWLDKYEDLKNTGTYDISFQYNGTSYILRVIANIVTETLQYTIYDLEENTLQSSFNLVEYPVNLATCKELLDCKLYFFENKFYQG